MSLKSRIRVRGEEYTIIYNSMPRDYEYEPEEEYESGSSEEDDDDEESYEEEVSEELVVVEETISENRDSSSSEVSDDEDHDSSASVTPLDQMEDEYDEERPTTATSQPQNDEQNAFLERETLVAQREVDIVRRETRLTRLLMVFVALFCLGSVGLVALYIVDPGGDVDPIDAYSVGDLPTFVPTVRPNATPTAPTGSPIGQNIPPPTESPTATATDQPTSLNQMTVTTTYSVNLPFGKENSVTSMSVVPDLISSMDLLAPQVLLEVLAKRNQLNRRILALVEVQLPTSIENQLDTGKNKNFAVDFRCFKKIKYGIFASHPRAFCCSVCPTASMVSQNDLCFDVTANVILIFSDGQEAVISEFEIVLNAALEQNRLQGALLQVSPTSQALVYKGDLPPTLSPTSEPSISISISPSLPGQSASVTTTPTIVPQPPSMETESPTSQPSTNTTTPNVTIPPTTTPQTNTTPSPTPGRTCDSDSLFTLLDGTDTRGMKALTFDVTASTDIIISELFLHLNSEIDLEIEIWTKENTWNIDGLFPYVGSSWDTSGWTRVLSGVGIMGNGFAELTDVGEFAIPVSVIGGSVQSFYIWTSSTTALIKGLTELEEQSSNEDIIIQRGAGFFAKPESDPALGAFSLWGVRLDFEGVIRYCKEEASPTVSPSPTFTQIPTIISAPNVTTAPTVVSQPPSIAPSPAIITPSPTVPEGCSAFDSLSTLLDGASTQQVPALLFDMTALSDITVNEISLHLKPENDLVVEIWTKEGTWSLDGAYPFVGTAFDRTGWTQVKSVVGVTGSGSSQLTTIGAFDTPVALTAGSVQSFYIWTNSNNAIIKDIITNSDVQASTSGLSIERAAGFYIKSESDPAKGSISIWGNGYEFEGIIEYCLDGGTSVTPAPSAPSPAITTPSPTVPEGCSAFDSLSTLLDGASTQQVPALLFDMTALSDITVNEISLHLKPENDLVVEIWTKEGTWSLDGAYPFVGTAFDRTGWTQVKSVVGVTGSGSSQLTTIGAFDTPVALTAGSVQSFYIWTNSNNAIIKDIITNSDVQASTSGLSIERAAGFYIKSESDPAKGSISIWGNGYEFEGIIEYCLDGGTSVTPAPSAPSPAIASPTPTSEKNRSCIKTDACDQNTEGFDICMDMDVDENTQMVALDAVKRWTSIITGDLPPVDSSSITISAADQCSCGAPAVIDDLYLCIKESTLDGPCDLMTGSGCILGTGAINNMRSDSSIPISGVVTIDSEDILFLKENPDIFNDVLTHEIGHALGIGTLWEILFLRFGNMYAGIHAMDIWKNDYGCSDSLPLDPSVHWDENCLTNELMTPVLTFGDANPITKITVGTLEDIGYTVDYEMAEDLTSNTVDRSVCCSARRGLGDQSLRQEKYNVHQSRDLQDSRFGVGDSSEIPPGISTDLYNKARTLAMEQLRRNSEHAPEVRDDGESTYVGDLLVHVYILNDEGSFGSLGFTLPVEEG